MVISNASENLLTLSEVSRRLPGRPHVNSIRRWIRVGVEIEGIGTVKLAGARCGRRVFVPAAAVAEFLAAQNPDHEPTLVTNSADHAAAEAKLRDMGL